MKRNEFAETSGGTRDKWAVGRVAMLLASVGAMFTTNVEIQVAAGTPATCALAAPFTLGPSISTGGLAVSSNTFELCALMCSQSHSSSQCEWFSWTPPVSGTNNCRMFDTNAPSFEYAMRTVSDGAQQIGGKGLCFGTDYGPLETDECGNAFAHSDCSMTSKLPRPTRQFDKLGQVS